MRKFRGAGLGVRLRHRVSRDTDWFTAAPCDATRVAQALAALPESPSVVTVQGPHSLRRTTQLGDADDERSHDTHSAVAGSKCA